MQELKISNKISVISLILANLIPLFGVLFLNWQLFSIMFLYWLESAVIGFYNILKMLKAEGVTPVNITFNDKPVDEHSRISIIFFFIFHYGLFMLGHGVFIFILFGPAKISSSQILIAFIFLFLSHGLSYLYNFIGEQEYKNISFSEQMMKPYSRIILMHITIILSGFTVKIIGASISALVIMIILKVCIDLYAHFKEHKAVTVLNKTQNNFFKQQ